jgi:hypothetical protein
MTYVRESTSRRWRNTISGLAAAAGRLRERGLVCRDVVHRATAQALTQKDGVSAMMRSSVRRPIRLMVGLLAM